jgi:arylsulfatase A-like enzyme
MIDRIRQMILGFFATVACALSLHSTERPNILIFLIDDMGLMDTSVPFLTEDGTSKAYPLNERYRTPAMKQLANQGLRFERYYANSVCSPSRVSLITGQNSARHRTTQWINPYTRNADRYAHRLELARVA